MSSKYKVLVVGMGKRGMHHATAFNANPKFQVAGICDIDPKRLDDAAAKLGNPQKGTWTAEVTNIEKTDYQFDPTKGDTTAEITCSP